MTTSDKTPQSLSTNPANFSLDERLHAGEREAQLRFGANGLWDTHRLNAMLHTDIPPRLRCFIENLPFFFIATSNTAGECDCSFRGREHTITGETYPLVKTLDSRTLVFPDYRGNKLYNSLGNILVNGHIGMLFIDFASRTRVRLNGQAQIIETPATYADIWPLAQRYVLVTTEQVFGNCKARIPLMTLVSPTDSSEHDN